ncbi:MAG: class I SAM-dependent methyltransferase [Streptococcaceae bacterium]|nr:class I SAM-dependent methyltransferase [Streptococcaceae bacterium]MCL2858219.1 class I SAM-dependent methyltransferase [Streptococcaceae bacterium]
MNHQHNHEQESQDFYDKIADHFDHTFDGFLASFFKRFIVKTLDFSEDIRILDVGCANGRLLSMLENQHHIDGFGLDISSQMVKVASEKYPQFTFKQGSSESIPFEEHSFDIVICSASFHHFPHPEQFLNEAERVLKENGRLIIAEIHIPIFLKLYNWRLHRFSKEGDVKVYSPKELKALFNKKGWKVIKRKIFFQIQYYEIQKLS